MGNIVPRDYQMECAQQVCNLISDGKRKITLLVPTGAGETIIAIVIAEKICNPNNKALIISDRKQVSLFCDGIIEEFGANTVESITIDDLLRDKKSADMFILHSLRPSSREKMKKYLSENNEAIVVSLGVPTFAKQEFQVGYDIAKEHTDQYIDKTQDVTKSFSKLVDYYKKMGNIQPFVYSTESILDIRDIISAENDEKLKLSEQIRADRDRIAHETALLSTQVASDPQYEDLKELVEKLQRKTAYYEQLLVSCGIPKDTLDEEFNSIESLRETLKDRFFNSDGSVNELAISQFETAVAESVVKCTKHVLTIENKDRYVDILKDLVSEKVWNEKLCDETKSYLITAKMNYEAMLGMENKEQLEYSGVCLLVTKALDVELAKRLYDRYIEYLDRLYPRPAQLSKWPVSMLNKDHLDVLEPQNFTLGTIMFVVGIDKEGTVKNNYVFRHFKEYAKKELYIQELSDADRETRIKNMVKYIEKIRNDYRNPSAHRNSMDFVTAEACMDYMLETYKKMKEILEDMI